MKIAEATISEVKELLASYRELPSSLYQELQQDQRKGVQSILKRWVKEREQEQHEHERIYKMWEIEREEWQQGFQTIGGIDEAGRGPWAGPVVAACVVVDHPFYIAGLNDSKQVTAEHREAIRQEIEKEAVAIGIGIVDHQLIDQINILQATYEAMRRAYAQVQDQVELCLVDALKIPGMKVPQVSLVKGDARSQSIAAASIIAKTTRDHLMVQYAEAFPQYGFERHKGYGTKEHWEAIQQYGPSPIHRLSFQPLRDWLQEHGVKE